MNSEFPALVVRRADDGKVTTQIESLTVDQLPDGELLIQVAYSSVNYKDALASQGHPGVVRKFPHVPGIDCAGVVAESSDECYPPGSEVIVTGYGLGAPHWGGHAGYVRVPAAWVVPLPAGLSLRDCMVYGTAGFTAAQSVAAIVERGIQPDAGEVLVTGATGGVGSMSVAILAQLGYHVVAATGKQDRSAWLAQLGAQRLLPREQLCDESQQPLLASQWAAAVDTVGGIPLVTVLRSMAHRGVVAACGLTAGDQLPLTVYPFILRGVTLAGIDSAQCPYDRRLEIWQRLAGPWRVDALESIATEIRLDQLPEKFEAILAGKVAGRTVVQL